MQDDQTSSTALTVLQGLLYSARQADLSHLVSQETIDACTKVLQATELGQKRLKQLDCKLFRASVPIIEKMMLPGITLHYVFRKKQIEDFVTEAIERGFTQIVNLGAGFDTLAYRLAPKHPEVSFIEIDHPATQALKAQALDQTGLTNLHYLPVDFAKQTLETELNQFSAFNPDLDTIFISEGVLMYLDIKDVQTLFHSLKALTHHQMEFIFTFIEPMSEHKDSYGWLLSFYLRFKKETLYWDIKRDELADFVAELDYELQTIIGPDEFKQRYLPDTQRTLHRGEMLAIAK